MRNRGAPVNVWRAHSRLDNPPSTQPDKTVEKAGTSYVADGLLISRDGHLYITSPEDSSVKPWEGDRARIVISEPRLGWPDSLAEAAGG